MFFFVTANRFLTSESSKIMKQARQKSTRLDHDICFHTIALDDGLPKNILEVPDSLFRFTDYIICGPVCFLKDPGIAKKSTGTRVK